MSLPSQLSLGEFLLQTSRFGGRGTLPALRPAPSRCLQAACTRLTLAVIFDTHRSFARTNNEGGSAQG